MYIRVVVYPGVKKEVVIKKGEDRFEVRVKEPAERNSANRRVLTLIAEIYSRPVRSLKIVSGHHNQQKIISIADIEVL